MVMLLLAKEVLSVTNRSNDVSSHRVDVDGDNSDSDVASHKGGVDGDKS